MAKDQVKELLARAVGWDVGTADVAIKRDPVGRLTAFRPVQYPDLGPFQTWSFKCNGGVRPT